MIIISLGGSIVAGEEWNCQYLQSFRNFMDNNPEKKAIVVGGGKTARNYINIGSKLGLDQYSLDTLGIEATRLNARLLITKTTYPHIPRTIDEAVFATNTYKNVVMGGTEPGHTTDAVSLMLAERLGVEKVINMTSVGGIYEEDPKRNKNAKKIDRLSYEDAERFFFERRMVAGLNIPFDLLSLKIAERSGIKIHIIGKDIENLKAVIDGEHNVGTVIG